MGSEHTAEKQPMICKRWWLALGLTVAMAGCEAGGGPSTPAPAASKAVPTSGNSGDLAVPATDVSKGQAPMPTGGTSPTGSDAAESKGGGADAGKAAATEVKLTDAEVAEIKKLPAADQEAALAQKVCPISESHLGDPDMGPPIKVTADGVTAFLCCESCTKKFQKDPKAALAKIGK